MTPEEIKAAEEKKAADAKAAADKAAADKVAHDKAAEAKKDPTEARRKANVERKQSESKELHVKMVKILNDHDNKESEIPLDSEYWGLLNQYRALR